ncbi:hypothetical protein MES5069_620102 [Mesorhizobium escarrei]|uniref:Uncharacterized protein n=1 Tax=Mesorhizobium escarrei TaxID=666018 RepID=A0ABN8KFB0_9HYPH|nr:hypothetical protein MES5069_620102 [Mesorhizobium escarrei]
MASAGKDAAPISPIAFEVVKRKDALFEIERDINGLAAFRRFGGSHERSCYAAPQEPFGAFFGDQGQSPALQGDVSAERGAAFGCLRHDGGLRRL